MGQTYNLLISGAPGTGTPFGSLYGTVNNLVEALRSAFSGVSFPTMPAPLAGQFCYRTDQNKLYIFMNNAWSEVVIENTGIGAEIVNARGTKINLDQRLDVALNEDGTLKASTSLNPSQWANLTGQTFAFVSATSFTVSGSQTDIYRATRRLKINHTASTVYSGVVSSSFDAGTNRTTVTILDAVINNTLISVEHSIISPLAHGGAVSPAMLGDMPSRHEHIQTSVDVSWTIIHNLDTPKIPVVRTYVETTEQIALSGFCGGNNHCGDGITCGSGTLVNVPVKTDITYSNFRMTSRNRLDIRFAEPRSGKAVILI